ncbi:putative sensory transduction protein [Arthrobacter sp. MN05-02]|nr:putative sensory transduction protein [Arthrobacter sp. MN05-02]
MSAILEQGGFQVSGVSSGREGVDVVRQEHPAVVTLDIGLPDIDGYKVLRRIRATTDCYVIVLSGRTDEMDILTALQAGADDYVLKPFRPREFRARIDAMLRRPRIGQNAQHPPTPPPAPAAPAPAPALAPAPAPAPAPDRRTDAGTASGTAGLLRNGSLVVDSEARTATCSGVELPLTKTEFNLLHALMASNGAVRTKEELVRVSRGRDYRGYNFVSRTDERAIEVHIANLRQKLARSEGDPELITTVRGVGFRIMPRRVDPGQERASG